MAAVVSFQSPMLRTWTGSLSDLNSCGLWTNGFSDIDSSYTYSNNSNWRSEPSSLSDINPMPEKDEPTSNALTVGDCLRIRHFLHEFHRSFTYGSVTADHLKQFPLTLFSSVINKPKDTKDYAAKFSTNNSGDQHHSKMFKALVDRTVEQCLQRNQSFPLLTRNKRRHYNSEGDITWSVSGNQHATRDEVSSKSLYSSDFSEPKIESTNRSDARYTGCDNLADSALFDCDNNPEAPKIDNYLDDHQDHITRSPDPVSLLPEVIASSTPSKHVAPVDIDTSGTREPNSTIPIVPPCANLNLNVLNFPSQKDDKLSSDTVTTSSRSESTGSGITSSASTPKMAKSVSFADEVGRSLTEIFTIEDQDYARTGDYDDKFDIHSCIYFRKPRLDSLGFSNRFTRSKLKQRPPSFPEQPVYAQRTPQTNMAPKPAAAVEDKRTIWVLGFSQPAAQYYEFRQRVENGSVSLENITLTQPDETSKFQYPQLSGTIKVKNLSFEKQVWIRLTTDNWQSYSDHIALYSPQLSGGLLHSAARFDTFSFQLTVVPQLQTNSIGDKVEFAIRYIAGEDGAVGQFWDNNNGKNYIIERKTINSNFPPHLSSTHDVEPNSLYAIDNFSQSVPSQVGPYTSDYRPNFEGVTQFTNYRAWNHFANETTYY